MQHFHWSKEWGLQYVYHSKKNHKKLTNYEKRIKFFYCYAIKHNPGSFNT